MMWLQPVYTRTVTLFPYTTLFRSFTSAAPSEASQRARSATASGDTHLPGSADGIAARWAGVSMVLGRTTLAVTPLSTVSAAIVRVSATRPAFRSEEHTSELQ